MRNDEGREPTGFESDAQDQDAQRPATDTSPTDAPGADPEVSPAALPDQPLDKRPATPRDSEETNVLRIDPATADNAPPSLTKTDTAPGAEAPSFHNPAARQDPDWRPGLLPRDGQGRPVTTSLGASSAPDERPPSGTPTTPRSPALPRRRAFDPMSMVAGVFFMGIAVTYLLDAGNAVDARPGIMLALAVIGVGASGFIGALWSLLTRSRKPHSKNGLRS